MVEERQPKPRETQPVVRSVRPETPPYGSESPQSLVGNLQALRASWPAVEDLVRAVEDGLYVAQANGRIALANPALASILGVQPGMDLLGHSLLELPIDAGHRRFPLPAGPFWIRRLDGREALVEHAPVRSRSLPEGLTCGVFRRATADRLSVLGVGAISILHDLRNVLTGLLGHADELLRADPADDVAARLGRLRELAMFGSEVAGQLVAFGAPTSARRGACHVNPAIQETVAAFRSRIPDTTSVAYDLSKDLPPVWMNPTRLRQVLMNLLLNAVGSFKGGVGTITFATATRQLAPTLPVDGRLETRRFGDYVEVVVRDTGSGIPDDVIDHVLNPFVTTTGGAGMGLAVVRETLVECGGGIEVESEVNVGTSFHIYLPIRQ